MGPCVHARTDTEDASVYNIAASINAAAALARAADLGEISQEVGEGRAGAVLERGRSDLPPGDLQDQHGPEGRVALRRAFRARLEFLDGTDHLIHVVSRRISILIMKTMLSK